MISNDGVAGPRVFLAHSSFDVIAAWRQSANETCGWTISGEADSLDALAVAFRQPDIDVFLVGTAFLALLPTGATRVSALGNPAAIVVAAAEGRDWAELHAALDRGACDIVVPGEEAAVWQPRIYRRWAEVVERLDTTGYSADDEDTAAVPAAVSEEATTTVVISGADGGTGKSFLATQLAGMLACHAAAKVCLVDYDLAYGALGELLKQPDSHDRCLADLTPVLAEMSRQHVASVTQTHAGGFSWLAGPVPGLAPAEIVDLAARLLDVIKDDYDVVIFDWPAPGLGPDVTIPFDHTFLVLTPDRSSAGCARRLAARLAASGEPAAILNRCDRPGALKAGEVTKVSGLDLAAEVPEDGGAGLLFDRDGAVLAARTDLAITRSLVAVAQRIRPIEALVQRPRLWQRRSG